MTMNEKGQGPGLRKLSDLIRISKEEQKKKIGRCRCAG